MVQSFLTTYFDGEGDSPRIESCCFDTLSFWRARLDLAFIYESYLKLFLSGVTSVTFSLQKGLDVYICSFFSVSSRTDYLLTPEVATVSFLATDFFLMFFYGEFFFGDVGFLAYCFFLLCWPSASSSSEICF